MDWTITRRIGKRFRFATRSMTCSSCGKPVVVFKNGRPRRTCSDVCRQRLRRKRLRERYGEDNRRARAAETTLKRVERYRGRADETPYQPRGLLNPRWTILFELRDGLPIRNCQWCAKPMPYVGRYRRRVPCCSAYCRNQFGAFRRKLHEALMTYEGQIDPLVTMRLREFNYFNREPQVVLRFGVNLCAHCNRPFAPYSLTRKYCSRPCRQAAYYRRHHRMVANKRHCLGCHKKFNARFVHQTTCGLACTIRYQNAAFRGRPGTVVRRCPECEQRFFTTNRNQKYCDANCRWRFHERKKRNPMTYVPVRERCMWCGETLPPPSLHGGKHRQTCSGRCRMAVWRMRRKGGVEISDFRFPHSAFGYMGASKISNLTEVMSDE